MAVSAGRQTLFWGVGLALFTLFMWYLGATMLPYLAGAGIAYLLDPVADYLESHGFTRAWATSIIVVVAIVVFGVAAAFLVPALIDQVQQLVEATPEMFAAAQTYLSERFPSLVAKDSNLWRSLASMQETLQSSGVAALNAVLASSLKVIDFVMFLTFTPVVTFYLLLDWDKMIARINSWLPREHADTIRQLAGEIDTVLAGFVRGQLLVCLILGAFYAIALMLIGLPFGFLVGVVAGLISFIPFVGAFGGGVLSIGIALFAFWGQPVWILATAAVFVVGQFVEGNILSPNLVGKSVGLHPVWLIFSLSVFGALFGFAGLLIAVPLAASLGVLGRFALDRYLESPLYTGVHPRSDR